MDRDKMQIEEDAERIRADELVKQMRLEMGLADTGHQLESGEATRANRVEDDAEEEAEVPAETAGSKAEVK